jgi:6,7-dimethyl-8-ribityllumazine synthase
MSVAGQSVNGKLTAKGLRVAILGARWNGELVERIIDCAVAEAQRHGVTDITTERVDGTGELPSAAQVLAKSGRFDAIVAVGVVVRGGTPHFDTVLQRATDGLLRVSLEEQIPVADCVVAGYDKGQIEVRAGGPGSHEDKGAAAMHAALDVALLKRKYAKN